MEEKTNGYGVKIDNNSDADDIDKTISRAISTFGVEAQMYMLFEEMAELQNALCKHTRGRDTTDHICEEIADVMIMCLQIAQIYGKEKVEEYAKIKISRLKRRLDKIETSIKLKN